MPYYSSFLDGVEELEVDFLKDRSLPTKVVLLRPDERVPLYWKGLTSLFRDRIDVIM
jgi:hypothetical protein